VINVTIDRYKKLELLIEIAFSDDAHAHWLLLIAQRMHKEGNLSDAELDLNGFYAEAAKKKLDALIERRNGVSLI
jgi:hypothetical protein